MESLASSKRWILEFNSLKCIVYQDDNSLKTECMFAAPLHPEACSEPCETFRG